MDFDWYLSPSDRFAHDTQFNSISADSDCIYVTQLDPVFQLSRLSQSEFLSIWNLIDIKSTQSLNREQFIYFLHVLAQRRKGKPLPIGIPLSIKESFLKDDSERRMYTRPGGRFETPKTRGDLQRDLDELVAKVDNAERENREAGERLAGLQTTAIEIASVVEYKQAHLDALKKGGGCDGLHVAEMLRRDLDKLSSRIRELQNS